MQNSSLSELIKNTINVDAAILHKIELPNIKKHVRIYLKREDLLQPIISGNKWRKLKYNLLKANEEGHKKLLTFGGAYSNHIHATAGAGSIFGFNTIGIIRGEQTLPLNSTLTEAKKYGMRIEYVDRKSYRNKTQPKFTESLKEKFGDFYLIPEGGTNQLAVKGCTEIIDNINIDYDYIFAACGTGGTLSGLICALNGNKKIYGIPVLKGAGFLQQEIEEHVLKFSRTKYNNWELKLDFHFGGYAKINKELVNFIYEFEELNKIQVEPIYTAKMLFGIKAMIENDEIPEDSTIIALHTGGLQGRAGMKEKIIKYLS